MPLVLAQNDSWMSPTTIVIVIIIVMLLFFFVRHCRTNVDPNIEEPYGSFYALPYAMYKDTNEYYPKDSALLFGNSKCCKSCCKNLWPLPFDVDDCPTCKDGKEDYVLSNYMCQGENGSGCVCVDKTKADFLDRRGNNKLVGEGVIFPNDGIQPVMAPETIMGQEHQYLENFSEVEFKK